MGFPVLTSTSSVHGLPFCWVEGGGPSISHPLRNQTAHALQEADDSQHVRAEQYLSSWARCEMATTIRTLCFIFLCLIRRGCRNIRHSDLEKNNSPEAPPGACAWRRMPGSPTSDQFRDLYMHAVVCKLGGSWFGGSGLRS